jgi:sialate O-acetylesterase
MTGRTWITLACVFVATGLSRAAEGPVPHRVYQRGADGTADIALDSTDANARVVGKDGSPVRGVSVSPGKLAGVPSGGPYTIEVDGKAVGPVFVGDLWVLAGQSNMEGYGDLIDPTPPHPLVQSLGMDGQWVAAREPLHWLIDSPDPVHSGDPAKREEASRKQHASRSKGAGLGLPFAVALVEATQVPVGLVPVAHGGTSMAQWDPSRKGDGGNSLYGSMLRSVALAGGKVKGVLWYQGESDANPQAAPVYPKVFADFIAALRSDLGQPELPFYYVQIGRFVLPNGNGENPSWDEVQEIQRTFPARVPHTACVSAIDLELDDLIHIGVEGHKRLGRRLANVALHELFGGKGATQPDLDTVTKGEGNTLRVKFRGVNTRVARVRAEATLGPRGLFRITAGERTAVAGLQPLRHIAGFSIRKEDGTEIPLIFDARLDPEAPDTVVLKLIGAVPPGSRLWYGCGLDPYCNLTDALDMAVPAFGPVVLDEVE